MVKLLANTFSLFRPFRALLLGDFMLDAYTTGRVKRISPEAPVPVMEVLKQESRPGGAGNVALNLAALGGSVIAMGRIGPDAQGLELKEGLAKSGVDVEELLIEHGLGTPVKTRLIADSQQLLRLDCETIQPVCADVENRTMDRIAAIIPSVQVVALSDYGKGFLSDRLIAAAIGIAKQSGVPVVVDPKGTNFIKYRGAALIKPNFAEACAAANLPASASLDDVARKIFDLSQAELLLITRSEAGMSLFDRAGNRSDFPVRSREVKDVTGAGDTVLAMIGLGMAIGLELPLAVQLANVAAGIAIERLGCVQVHLSEIAERLLETDCKTKIFDETQLYALQQVLKAKPYALLVLEKGQTMTGSLYRAIRKLSLAGSRKLVLYVCDCHLDDDFIHLLSSLHEVKAIVLQQESLQHLCGSVHPQEIFYLQGELVAEGRDRLSALLDASMTAPPRHRSSV